jgi:hypothetical protein
VSDFQTWAQSIDPKVWSKNDLHYSKLAWDEGRKELDAKLSDQRKNRIATIDVVQESYELKERIDELEAKFTKILDIVYRPPLDELAKSPADFERDGRDLQMLIKRNSVEVNHD